LEFAPVTRILDYLHRVVAVEGGKRRKNTRRCVLRPAKSLQNLQNPQKRPEKRLAEAQKAQTSSGGHFDEDTYALKHVWRGGGKLSFSAALMRFRRCTSRTIRLFPGG